MHLSLGHRVRNGVNYSQHVHTLNLKKDKGLLTNLLYLPFHFVQFQNFWIVPLILC